MTYNDVMATTTVLDLADPAAAAAAIDALNDELAAVPALPAGMGEAVAGVASAVRATPLDRWTAADPYLALLVHRAVLDARAAADDAGAVLLTPPVRRPLALAAPASAAAAGAPPTPKELARWLADTLEVPQRDLAALLGIDLRRFQRWISARERTQPEGEEARRVRAVARIAAQLRHAFTPAGVVAWFDWPRPELGGATPRELLGDPVRLPELVLAAGATRSTSFA